MRLRALPFALAALVALTACGNGSNVTTDYRRASPAPTTVSCTDGPQLRQRAIDDRRRADELKSDHERIYTGNRATFFASLAIIADLKCRVTLAEADEADEALKPAFEAARRAEDTRSMYRKAFAWGEAGFIATQVSALLIQQLPAPAAQ
jgi:hypothetical protein